MADKTFSPSVSRTGKSKEISQNLHTLAAFNLTDDTPERAHHDISNRVRRVKGRSFASQRARKSKFASLKANELLGGSVRRGWMSLFTVFEGETILPIRPQQWSLEVGTLWCEAEFQHTAKENKAATAAHSIAEGISGKKQKSEFTEVKLSHSSGRMG